jgi:hypothetical protein
LFTTLLKGFSVQIVFDLRSGKILLRRVLGQGSFFWLLVILVSYSSSCRNTRYSLALRPFRCYFARRILAKGRLGFNLYCSIVVLDGARVDRSSGAVVLHRLEGSKSSFNVISNVNLIFLHCVIIMSTVSIVISWRVFARARDGHRFSR